jgi:hypothetical protein
MKEEVGIRHDGRNRMTYVENRTVTNAKRQLLGSVQSVFEPLRSGDHVDIVSAVCHD